MPKHIPINVTPQQLDAIMEELGAVASDIRFVAQLMRETGVEEMEVVNYGLVSKAVKGCRSFVATAKNTLYDTRVSRGDFGESPKQTAQQGKKGTRSK